MNDKYLEDVRIYVAPKGCIKDLVIHKVLGKLFQVVQSMALFQVLNGRELEEVVV